MTDATPTSDQVCGRRASTWDYVVPILAGVVVLVAIGAYLYRRRGEKIQLSLEMNGRLLGDQERKQKGWMISEAELTRGKQIAQGSFGVVHAGTWGHIDVAIKTYIDHGDPSALDQAVDEFQKEAEFMQSICLDAGRAPLAHLTCRVLVPASLNAIRVAVCGRATLPRC